MKLNGNIELGRPAGEWVVEVFNFITGRRRIVKKCNLITDLECVEGILNGSATGLVPGSAMFCGLSTDASEPSAAATSLASVAAFSASALAFGADVAAEATNYYNVWQNQYAWTFFSTGLPAGDPLLGTVIASVGAFPASSNADLRAWLKLPAGEEITLEVGDSIYISAVFKHQYFGAGYLFGDGTDSFTWNEYAFGDYPAGSPISSGTVHYKYRLIGRVWRGFWNAAVGLAGNWSNGYGAYNLGTANTTISAVTGLSRTVTTQTNVAATNPSGNPDKVLLGISTAGQQSGRITNPTDFATMGGDSQYTTESYSVMVFGFDPADAANFPVWKAGTSVRIELAITITVAAA